MPIYRNDGSKTIRVGGMTLEPGQSDYTPKYIVDLATRYPDLVLVTPNAAPWVTLHSAVIGGGVVLGPGLAVYKSIHIYNGSGAVVEIAANGDIQTLPLGDGYTHIIENDGLVDALSVSGAGGGNVYITGLY
jgi:hypothetical protein